MWRRWSYKGIGLMGHCSRQNTCLWFKANSKQQLQKFEHLRLSCRSFPLRRKEKHSRGSGLFKCLGAPKAILSIVFCERRFSVKRHFGEGWCRHGTESLPAGHSPGRSIWYRFHVLECPFHDFLHPFHGMSTALGTLLHKLDLPLNEIAPSKPNIPRKQKTGTALGPEHPYPWLSCSRFFLLKHQGNRPFMIEIIILRRPC